MNASIQGQDGGRAFGGNLLRVLLAAGVVLLLWRGARGITTLFWMLFGLAMALFWSGGWRLLA